MSDAESHVSSPAFPRMEPRGRERHGRAARQSERAGVSESNALQNQVGSLFFRSQQWKQDYVADGLRTSEQHRESIHPDADAAGGRHAMLERE